MVPAPITPPAGAGLHVAVVGGGIAGLCCAYYLTRAGARVTVLESNRIGSAASSGNAGWLAPAQAGPLPEPGLTAYGLRSLVDRRSALYFSPAQLPRMLPWLAAFARRCNARDHAAGVRALAELGGRVFALVDAMRADGVAMELHKQGLLVAAREPDAARRFLAGLEPMRELGYDVPDGILEGRALRDAEPALGEDTRAGLRIGEHWHVLPDSLIAGLAAWLRAAGAAILEGAEVVDLETDGDAISRVRTAAGDVDADAVVLAAGAWSPRLARLAGLRLPVQAGKGYSLSVRPSVVPRHALLLAEPHVGCTPFGERLRVAGTMEFSGINARLDRRRIAPILDGARGMLAPLHPEPPRDLWTGMRPIAPDGLPIIDRAPGLSNAYVATAYSMLGMTVAAPAAEALAELVLTGRRPPLLAPFSATRFGRVFGGGPRGIRPVS